MKPVWKYAMRAMAAMVAMASVAMASEAGGHAAEPELISGINQGLVTAVTTLVIFAVLLAVLGKFAWGPIADGLRKREDRIRKDIADAEAARLRAEGTLKEYQKQLATAEQKVREMIAIASREGEKVAAEIRAKGQTEAEEAKERAKREIEAASKQAVAEIYQKAAELSTSIAAKILKRNINAEDQRELVERSLEQMRGVEN